MLKWQDGGNISKKITPRNKITHTFYTGSDKNVYFVDIFVAHEDED